MFELLVAHAVGQFRTQPRRPLLDVGLMVLRGTAQLRVQRVEPAATRVAVAGRTGQGEPAVQCRDLLRIDPAAPQLAPTPTHGLGLLKSSSAAYGWRITGSRQALKSGDRVARNRSLRSRSVGPLTVSASS